MKRKTKAKPVVRKEKGVWVFAGNPPNDFDLVCFIDKQRAERSRKLAPKRAPKV